MDETTEHLDVVVLHENERTDLITFLRDNSTHLKLTTAQLGRRYGQLILRIPTKNARELWDFICTHHYSQYTEDGDVLIHADVEDLATVRGYLPDRFNSDVRLDD